MAHILSFQFFDFHDSLLVEVDPYFPCVLVRVRHCLVIDNPVFAEVDGLDAEENFGAFSVDFEVLIRNVLRIGRDILSNPDLKKVLH